jgi:hypothetical protein
MLHSGLKKRPGGRRVTGEGAWYASAYLPAEEI